MPSSTTAELPLRQHGLLQTESIDQAVDVVSRVYVPHTLELGGSKRRLDAILNAVSSPTLTFGYLTYGADTTVVLPPMEACYHINLTLRGHSSAQCGDQQARTVGLRGGQILRPDRPSRVTWFKDAEQYALKVPRAVLEEHLTTMLNRPWSGVIPFDTQLDLNTPAGKGLLRLANLYQQEWDEDGALVQLPSARHNIESLLLSKVLQVVGAARFDDERDITPSGWLQDAVEFIHASLDTLPTVVDVARFVGVSVRTLERGFRAQYSVSPARYLADLRMRQTREELRGQLAPGTTVTSVAMKWGFYHPGRYSAAYFRRYGERPSETLKRNGVHTERR